MQKVRGALGRMRHRELSTSVLQWLTYADGQACTLHAHTARTLHVACCMHARCTHAARTLHARCMHAACTLHARCMHAALLLSTGRRAAVR
jgi:hypothetical protein